MKLILHIGTPKTGTTAVQRFLHAGVEAGEFHVPDAKVAGIAVLDLLKGVDAWMREPGRLGRRQVADTYSVLILSLMGAKP